MKFRAHGRYGIIMTHPHLLRGFQPREEGVVPPDLELRPAPLSTAVDDFASIVLRNFLVTEAEPYDGDVEVVDALRIVLVLAVG